MRTDTQITFPVIQRVEADVIHLISRRNVGNDIPVQVYSTLCRDIKPSCITVVQIPIPVDVPDLLKILGIKEEPRSI